MTSDEFRALLYGFTSSERRQVAEAFGVDLRTAQRWSSYGAERRDALRSNPDIGRMTEAEVLLGLRGATASHDRPANKGSGEIGDQYVFRTFAEASRFAMRVKEGRTSNEFLNNAVTSIRVIRFGDNFSVEMTYSAAYSESEGWADSFWDDFDNEDEDDE